MGSEFDLVEDTCFHNHSDNATDNYHKMISQNIDIPKSKDSSSINSNSQNTDSITNTITNINTNSNSNSNTNTNFNMNNNTGHSNTKTHKRGAANSLFNSDSTLVDNFSNKVTRTISENSELSSSSSSIHSSSTAISHNIQQLSSNTSPIFTSSSNSNTVPQSPALSTIMIQEESEEDEKDKFANDSLSKNLDNTNLNAMITNNSNSNYNNNSNSNNNHNTFNFFETTSTLSHHHIKNPLNTNRGLLNRSKFHGLGHRTTKSENFNTNLKKNLFSMKNIGNNYLPRRDTNQHNVTTENHEHNDSRNTSFVINNNTKSRNTLNLSLNLTPNKSYFDPPPSAPADSQNKFTFLENNDNKNTENNTSEDPNLSNHPNIFINSTPMSSEFNFSNISNTISSPMSSSFKLISPIDSTFKLNNSSNNSLPTRSSAKFKSNKIKIPENVTLLKLKDSQSFIQDFMKSIGSDKLPNLLIIDVRPFHDYCKSHISNSINICLPSTLLKRSTFTLDKCIHTLTSKEKKLFTNYYERDSKDLPSVLFYDDFVSTEDSISSSIYYLVDKFLRSSNWNSSLYILEGGFTKFDQLYNKENNDKNLKESDNNEKSSSTLSSLLHNDHSTTSVNSCLFSPISNLISPHSVTSPENFNRNNNNNELNPSSITELNTKSSNNNHASKSPIGLSRFLLPDTSNIPIFKTKNYDEVLSDVVDTSIHLANELSPSQISLLPNWLSQNIGQDLGSSELTKKFNKLQLQERERLSNTLHGHKNNPISTKDHPIISAGVELGRKNRYKDIFLYEHSRVKLENDLTPSNENFNYSTYINASYINYTRSNLNYIATQGPLDETIGDFWKIVYDNNVPIIFSLTPQSENNIEKCAPFWNPGVFQSNSVRIETELIDRVDDLKLCGITSAKCIARVFTIKVDNSDIVKKVLQVHMMSWPDFGIVICEEDILSLVSLKRYIYDKLNITDAPTLVHCSAGCGRTGSFCAIDTCIDVLLKDEVEHVIEKNDLIFEITSNFRSQRVFMVQTLRQYILIYDSIIKYLQMHHNADVNHKEVRDKNGDLLTNKGLINWEVRDPGILGKFIESYI
ncbi:tyrosine protein phosphatase [Pichia kluyveri]|uniref:protein-tyrosine-phosphatase n=1 Tax=Pichia kluyveri TaxID=36015 RepID=A0AAV5R8K4_PICKL|nr:tyrosine protein phosphatase [Pichia kluyveri]